jgi:hypothetical protein
MGQYVSNTYFGRYREGGTFFVGMAVSQESTKKHKPFKFGERKSGVAKGPGWVRYDQHCAAALISRAQWESSMDAAETAWYTALAGAEKDDVWACVHATAVEGVDP